jgi:hypothetical protein
MTNREVTAPHDCRAHRTLAGWCVAVAALGTPTAALVLLLNDGPSSAAGVSVIATISVAALATARSLARPGQSRGTDVER